MTKKTQVILLHILVWIQFLILPLVFFPAPFELVQSGESGKFLSSYIITNVFLILIFYFNYLYAIPKYYFKHQYYTYGAIVSSFIVISIVLAILSKHTHPSQFLVDRESDPPVVGSILIRLVIVLVASFGLKVFQRWRETEIEKSNVELSYLKAQINPHFLFNTLNGIYALAVRKSDDTAGAIVKLSSIMRYVINDAKEEYVSLDKEIKYVSDYIDLQKMRLNKYVKVISNVEGNSVGKRIVPMLYISFIENAFKYGVSTEGESLIEIQQTIFRNELTIKVKNTIVHQNQIDSKVEETGIGIDNSRLRLEQTYAGKFQLLIDKNEDYFIVELKIELK
jgi:LytS/YehU family sensor histidine kinase